MAQPPRKKLPIRLWWPWMTLNSRNVLLQKKTFYGAHHKNLNEDYHTISGKMYCWPMILYSRNIIYCMHAIAWEHCINCDFSILIFFKGCTGQSFGGFLSCFPQPTWMSDASTDFRIFAENATDFKFGRYIHGVHPNKTPLKVWRKGSVGVTRDCPMFSRTRELFSPPQGGYTPSIKRLTHTPAENCQGGVFGGVWGETLSVAWIMHDSQTADWFECMFLTF